jgi:50S ribosome-binding GTPase
MIGVTVTEPADGPSPHRKTSLRPGSEEHEHEWHRNRKRTVRPEQRECGLGTGGPKFRQVNLAVFGKTGVGKSTLINAIFGEEVARTGIGRPVTEGSRLYVTRSGSLGLYDRKVPRNRYRGRVEGGR